MQEFPLPFWEKNKSNNHKLAEKIQSNKYFHHEQTKHFHQYKMDTILEKTKVCKIGWSHGLVRMLSPQSKRCGIYSGPRSYHDPIISCPLSTLCIKTWPKVCKTEIEGLYKAISIDFYKNILQILPSFRKDILNG